VALLLTSITVISFYSSPAASLPLRFLKFILSVGAPVPRAQYDGFLFSDITALATTAIGRSRRELGGSMATAPGLNECLYCKDAFALIVRRFMARKHVPTSYGTIAPSGTSLVDHHVPHHRCM